MLGKLFEGALKVILSGGIKEIQKSQLNKTASKDGEIIATISCTLRRTGQLLHQEGKVAITKQSIHFKVVGRQNNLTGSETIPVNEMSYVNTTFTRIWTNDAVELKYNNKTYLFVFPKGQRDIFENAIKQALRS